MVESTLMTNVAWEKTPKTLLKGYCSMPYIVDNLECWFIETTDRLSAHHTSLSTMEIRANEKYISLKEEGSSLHVNHV